MCGSPQHPHNFLLAPKHPKPKTMCQSPTTASKLPMQASPLEMYFQQLKVDLLQDASFTPSTNNCTMPIRAALLIASDNALTMPSTSCTSNPPVQCDNFDASFREERWESQEHHHQDHSQYCHHEETNTSQKLLPGDDCAMCQESAKQKSPPLVPRRRGSIT